MWKLYALAALSATGCWAQTCTITSPTSGQVLSGYSGTNLTVSLSGVSNADHVQYYIDGYPAYDPGLGPASVLGISSSAPNFAFPYDSFWDGNGPHVVSAYVYSLASTVLASCTQLFSISNTWPNPNALVMNISTSTSVGSNWSGIQTVTPTVSGTGAGSDSITYQIYVDGMTPNTVIGSCTFNCSATSITSTATSPGALTVPTTLYQNGNHNVCVVAVDNTSGQTYSPGTQFVGGVMEWCAPAPGVNFQNGAVASQPVCSAHDIYMTPGSTYTLSCQTMKTDGSTTASSAYYFSANTAIATVNNTTGVITAVSSLPAVSQTNSQIYVMIPTATGTNLSTNGGVASQVTAGTTFKPYMIGWMVEVTGGTGFTTGSYIIKSCTAGGTATLNAAPAAAGTNNGSFSVGPTLTYWANVWTSNTLPHFGSDGSRLTAYNPALSYPVHEIFKGLSLLPQSVTNSDQPYGVNGTGAAMDLNASAVQVLEADSIYTGMTGSESSQTTWQTNQTNYVTRIENAMSGTALKLALTCQNSAGGDAGLWGATSGNPSAWSPPGMQYAWQSWNGQTNNVVIVPCVDEVNSTYPVPLQGPITLGSATSPLNWLDHITSNGTTCEGYASASGWQLVQKWIITGSSVTNMNSTTGNVNTFTKIDNTHFTWPCTVASGTYGNGGTADGATIQPLANAWHGSSYNAYNALALFRTQFLNASTTFGMDWPNQGGTTAQVLASFEGNGNQSIGSVTQMSDYGTVYNPVGTPAFLIKRMSAHELLGVGELGFTLRNWYGSYSPSLPLVAETWGTSIAVGDSGYSTQTPPIALTSCSGNLCTVQRPARDHEYYSRHHAIDHQRSHRYRNSAR